MDASQIRQSRDILERHKTADSVREYAYQLWAFEYGRSPAKVARELECHPSTVEKWAKRQHWAQRADQDIRALMPDLRQQAADIFSFAVLHLARRALAIAKAMDEDNVKPDYREVESIVKLAGLAGFSTNMPLPSLTASHRLPDLNETARSTADLIAQHHARLGLPSQ